MKQRLGRNHGVIAHVFALVLGACSDSPAPLFMGGAAGNTSSQMGASEMAGTSGSAPPAAAGGGATGMAGTSSVGLGAAGNIGTAAVSGSGGAGSGGSAAGAGTMAAGGSGGSARADAGTQEPIPEPEAVGPFEGEGQPWTAAAPRAKCGTGDQVDSTISGLSEDLRCNLELVGEVDAPHFLSLAWHKDCAYVNGPDGTTVVQVGEDGAPKVTTTLTEVGFRSNWESMKASSETGLLVGYEANGARLAAYDLNNNCAMPEFAGSLTLNGELNSSIGHAGSFSPENRALFTS